MSGYAYLNSDEERVLAKILQHTENDQDAASYINALYEECNLDKNAIHSLARKGMIGAYFLSDGVRVNNFGGLTSDGSSYLKDKEERSRIAKKEKWGARGWQIVIAVIGVVLSIIASIITVNIKIG